MTAASSTTTLPPAPDPLTDAFPWLKSMPLAPTYYPTIAEFEDPIAYIFKIEKEASRFGICKIVPPLPPPPKKTAVAHLNRSLASRDGGEDRARRTFTTRQQQIGFCPRKSCPVKRPVWQSGEEYTVQEFEAKARVFEKHYLKKWPKGKGISALEMETLFWKANADKPFRIEYANDMPGSAFVPLSKKKKGVSVEASGGGGNAGDSSWNMRGVSRAKGSLLKFMKEEIPGVTSPMLYIAMMFCWFAWHVEDHDLHSLNYLHIGAGKTWYGVPREAAVAFEEVVRVHGYGEEVNALGTFAALGEKTTVIPPEVFITAGVPCCRLVQYAGEFVVTFPRAYHSGFSHGFNCGEAANIATPEWLTVAKDAAIRRASINLPPMVSHLQLLYDLALSLCSRIPVGVTANPRSLRLKDKNKNEGETLVKELFVQNVARNNGLLHILAKGSSVVLLPQSSTENSVCPSMHFRSELRGNTRLPLRKCSPSQAIEWSNGFFSDDVALDRSHESQKSRDYYTMKEKIPSQCGNSRILHSGEEDKYCATSSHTLISGATSENVTQGDRISNQRLFSCVTCGILIFDCVAIIQPKAPAARHLMSADSSIINDLIHSGEISKGVYVAGQEEITPEQNSSAGIGRNARDGLYNVPVQSAKFKIQSVDQNDEMFLNCRGCKDNSALGLLAMTYGNSSDDEDDQNEPVIADSTDDMMLRSSTPEIRSRDEGAGPSSFGPGYHLDSSKHAGQSLYIINHKDEVPVRAEVIGRDVFEDDNHQPRETINVGNDYSLVVRDNVNMSMCKKVLPAEETNMLLDKDSCRIHVFCLEHALEVEQRLCQIGGAHMILLCHPDYPQLDAEARIMAKEIGTDYSWNDILFRDSTEEDKDQIQVALDSEDAIPGNGDWAVKLGINLFYSANLSRSSVYSKQMPYNSVIYNAFGRNTLATSPTKSDVYCKRSGRKKKVVAGKWCGRVWMSNQVHPLLVQRDLEDGDEKGERKFHVDEIDKPVIKHEKNQNTRANAVTKRSGKRKIIVGKDTDSDTSLYDLNPKRQKKFNRAPPTRFVERGERSSADPPECFLPHRSLLKGEQSDSEDLDENSLQQLWGISKRKQLKCSAGKNANSDDSMGNSPSERRGKNSRSKLFKYVGSDYENSDDSFTLYAESSRGKHAKIIERNNHSEDSVEYDSPHFSAPRGSRHAKFFTREDTDSDDSLSNVSHRTNKKVRGRRAKYIEKRDTVSDGSLEDNSLQRPKKIVRKQTDHVDRQDVSSDGSLEDNSYQQNRRTVRKNQTKSGNLQEQKQKRDTVLDGSLENNSLQRRKKIVRKQTDHVDRQDVSSDGSLEDNSYQQNRRTVRKNQTKSGNLQEQKQKTSHQYKRSVARRKRGTTLKMRHEASVQKESACEEELESGPNTRLRTRSSKKVREAAPELPVEKLKEPAPELPVKKLASQKSVKKAATKLRGPDAKSKDEENEYPCDIEGCSMSFCSKRELLLHKKNICPVKGCQKKFFSHKYLVQHRKVHMDDRPLKCPWKGCEMTFKWPWARTEHIRVHTGARPYVCTETGCGQTFRFVSDFSRHKRKTGHSAKKGRG